MYLLGGSAGEVRFGTTAVDPGGFLARFDERGDISWIVGLPSLQGGLYRPGSVQASAGAVVVASGFGDAPFDFGDGEGTRTPRGPIDGYIASFSAAGSPSWVRVYAAPGAFVRLSDVSIDRDGNVYATGGYSGTVDVGLGPQTAIGAAIVVLSLNPAGRDRWVAVFDSAGVDGAEAIAVGSDALFVTGAIGGSVDFGGGAVATSRRTGYLLALELDGAYRWERILRGFPTDADGEAEPSDVAVMEGGRVWVIGEFSRTVNFGGGGVMSFVVPGDDVSSRDIFVSRYGDDGLHLRDRPFRADLAQRPWAIAEGPGGAVTMVGSFHGSVDFGSGTYVSSGGQWGFVARIVD